MSNDIMYFHCNDENYEILGRIGDKVEIKAKAKGLDESVFISELKTPEEVAITTQTELNAWVSSEKNIVKQTKSPQQPPIKKVGIIHEITQHVEDP